MNSRSFLVTLIWFVALVAIGYHAAEMHQYVWNVGGGPLTESPSAVQQAAMAAYRTGMMVLFYALGRGLTDTIKVTIPSDE
jgi:hypothetical protein